MTRPFSFLAATLAAMATAAVWDPPAQAEFVPATGGQALSLEQRVALECPDKAVPGGFAQPSEIWPSPDIPVDLTYSAHSDLVRLVGEETEANVALGAGDDVVLLYDAGAGMSLRGDSGADTILLCSMDDLDIGFTPGTENLARDEGQDVIIIDSPVFVSVPAGMRRNIMIHGFDAAVDKVVVRAPRQLMETREILNIRGIRIGDVLVTINAAVGSSEVDFDSDSVVLVPDDNVGRIARQDMQRVGRDGADKDKSPTTQTGARRVEPDGHATATTRQAAPPPAAKANVPWAPGCEFLQLDRIWEPTEVSGVAPADGVVCYAIKPSAGSEISIEVVEGRNVMFSVSDLVDGMDRYAFRASGYGYQINVVQLMRSASSEPYRIVIRGGESTEPRPAPAATVEATLREKVMDFVGRSYEEAGLRLQPDLEVDITPADLDGDGNPEALVMVRSFLDCGSRGCAGYVLDLSGPAPRSIGDFIGERLEAAQSVTGGWRDVLLDGGRFVYRSGKYVFAGKAGGAVPPDSALVLDVQERLAALGYDPGRADGVYGRKTRAAIKAFLADRGLRREARIDDGLVAALDSATAADAVAPDGPGEFLSRIYTLPDPDVGIFGKQRRARYFSPRLVGMIEATERAYLKRYGLEELDFNPVVPGQDWNLSDLTISDPVLGADRAAVTVRFVNRIGDPDTRHEMLYEFVRSGESWFIDEIMTDGSALSALLQEAAGEGAGGTGDTDRSGVQAKTASAELDGFLDRLFPDCAGSPEFNHFRSTLHERYGHQFDGSRINPARHLAIPDDLRPHIGAASSTNEGEFTKVVIPLTGSFRSLAVSALEFAFGNENGINALSLRFTETLDRVRAVLGPEVADAARRKQFAGPGKGGSVIEIISVGDRVMLVCDLSL